MNFRVRQLSPRFIASITLSSLLLTLIVGFLAAPPRAASMAATFTVNNTDDSVDVTPGDGTCADSLGRCTLRAAVMEANASSGPDTINLPAGTYTLTLGPADDEENFDGARPDIGDLDVLSGDLSIVGAGAATTIIDGGGIDRIIEVNNFIGPGVAVDLTISDVTLRNGNTQATPSGFFPSGGAIQFDGFDLTAGGPSERRLTLTNCIVTGNQADSQGGGVSVIFGSLTLNGTQFTNNESTNSAGGAVAYDAGAAAGSRSLVVTNSSFSNNRAPNSTLGNGGAIQADGNASQTIENSSFSGNTAGALGGAISSGAALAANSKQITKSKFEGNTAASGGAVFNRNGTAAFTFNLVVGNSATADSSGTGFRNGVSTAPGSLATLTNNWWGCNVGPGFDPCDRAAGSAGFVSGPWLVLSHAATPNTIDTNQSTSLQADFFTPSSGGPIDPVDLVVLEGRAITFNNAFLGTISAADTQIAGGKANATFTAGATAGNGSADATVDDAVVTANITITQAPAITCPANITVGTDPGQCSAAVSFSTTATGSPAPTVVCRIGAQEITSPHTFPVGETTVECTASNGVGADATCSFTVTVNDNENPTVTAPADVTVHTGPGAVSCSTLVAEGTLGTASAADNCSGVSIERTGVPAGNIFPVGQTVVTYTATDASGNQAVDTQTVTVIDNTPPVIVTCSPPQSASAGAGGQAPVPDFTSTVVATDNCAVTSVTQSPIAGTLVGTGVTNVTITVADAAGNTTSCITTFTVSSSNAVTSVGPAKVWIGLKNSDDVGVKFDLLAQGLKNGVVVASGQLNGVSGGSSGFNNAIERTINMALTGGPVPVQSGDTLSFKLSVRVAATGHSSGTARLWYNDHAADSRVSATIAGLPLTGYLWNGFTLNIVPGFGPKKTIDVHVNRNQGGNPFKPFGTWNVTVP